MFGTLQTSLKKALSSSSLGFPIISLPFSLLNGLKKRIGTLKRDRSMMIPGREERGKIGVPRRESWGFPKGRPMPPF